MKIPLRTFSGTKLEARLILQFRQVITKQLREQKRFGQIQTYKQIHHVNLTNLNVGLTLNIGGLRLADGINSNTNLSLSQDDNSS